MEQRKKRALVAQIRFVLFILAIISIIKFFMFSSFMVVGASMQPTLQENDRLLVHKINVHSQPMQRGDIIIIKKPNDPKYYVKRVIGLPKDVVKILKGELYVNNKKRNEPYLENSLLFKYKQLLNFNQVTVPSDKLFVLGDNRLNSQDSRNELGYIDLGSVVGKAEFVYYPLNKIHSLD
ncbi:signal peptidase I [Bacillus cereus]|uniref:signal peptidase I n=1 Tax=Bacillus cereus TaxID=1396 RepID=UPI00247FD043|nr:signal peptidase I [Bacillus cereus]MDH8001269.1 signal peptidase I [Bacillus cereus]